MNSISIIHNYDSVVSKLIEDIKKSDFKVAYFLKLLDVKDSFFYKKMREKRFTIEEVKLLSKHLYPNEYQTYQEEVLSICITEAKNQLEKGEGVDFETILAKSKQQYGI